MGYISSNPQGHNGSVVSSDLYRWTIIQIKIDMKAGSRPRHVGFCTCFQGQFKNLKILGTVLVGNSWKINLFENWQQGSTQQITFSCTDYLSIACLYPDRFMCCPQLPALAIHLLYWRIHRSTLE